MFIPVFIFTIMFVLHVIADFNVQIQGMLNDLKCREWWEKNAPNPKYRFDYVCALCLHGICWAGITFLPVLLLGDFRKMQVWYVCAVIMNATIHAIIDSAKANSRRMNLWADQICHVIQIGVTLWVLCFV